MQHASPEEQTMALRAVVALNDVLGRVLEDLRSAQILAGLPSAVQSALAELLLEAARLQGATEWVAERIVVIRCECQDGLPPDDGHGSGKLHPDE